MVGAAEDAVDARAVDTFRRKLAAGEEEFIPSSVADRLFDGENRVKVWREYRGLTSQALAERAGIGQSFLSQIENFKRSGTVETLRKIAAALDLTVDELIDENEDVGEQKNKKIIRLIRSATNGVTLTELIAKTGTSDRHAKEVCDHHSSKGDIERRGDLYFWIATEKPD